MMFSALVPTRFSKAHIKVMRETVRAKRKQPGNANFKRADLIRLAVAKYCIAELGTTAKHMLGQGAVIDRAPTAPRGALTQAAFEAALRGGKR